MRECLQWLGAERQWIDRKHWEVCRIPAPTFQEDERAAWMADEFRSLGYDVMIDRAGNVIAGLDLRRAGSFVALTAHLDTVLAPRKPDDIRVNGRGRMQGPGVSDNGSGLAALLAIAAVAARRSALGNGAGRLVFVANVGEEGEGNLSGMRYLCRRSEWGDRIASYLVLDGPFLDHVTCRAVASRRFEVTVSGPGGHSWSDFGVGNPVHALSRAVTLYPEERAAQLRTASNGCRTTYNFGIIDGGTSVNAIPVTARAKVDLRAEDPAQIEVMTALLTSVVERALGAENDRSIGPKMSAKIREIGSRPGGRLGPDAPILDYLRAVDAYLGIRAQEDCASTDANVPLSMGREAVSIGAGGHGGGAHTPEEWFDPEGREMGLKRILLVTHLLVEGVEGAGKRPGT